MGSDYAVYVIELEPDRDPEAMWYVGISKNPEQRYREHCVEYGSAWTNLNTCVGMDVLLWGEERHMRSIENRLTLALWDEYGPGTTQGGKYTGRRAPEKIVPEIEDVHISPPLASALKETDNEKLAKVGEKSRVYMEIGGKIPFKSVVEAGEWADRELPEDTEIKLSTPDYDLGVFYSENSEDAERIEFVSNYPDDLMKD